MILVTGASGFVGQHLVRLLSGKGHTVRALYNSTAPDAALQTLPGVSWMQCDLLDIFAIEEAMVGVDDVYHCAGMVSFNARDKEALMHFNVESTANIVNQALEQGIRKLICVSSVAALGRSHSTKAITEAEEWEENKHTSVYGMSKYLAEMEVWRGMAEGLSAVVINPTMILGEASHWDKGSARMAKVVHQQFPFYTEGITGWIDVRDVARIAYELMQSDVEAERFIVSAGNYQFRDIFTRMANAMNRKPPHIKASRFMTGIVWRWNYLHNLLTGKAITVTKETAATAHRQTHYDNSKLFRFLQGFSYTPIDDTIQRMASAYLRSLQ